MEQKEFFTKGTTYRCIRNVVMRKTGKTAFKSGGIYKQAEQPTPYFGWLRNEQGESHAWPQPARIEHEANIWDATPESIDPRLYFEPVNN